MLQLVREGIKASDGRLNRCLPQRPAAHISDRIWTEENPEDQRYDDLMTGKRDLRETCT